MTEQIVENVHVVVRQRPFSEEELLSGIKDVATIDGQTITLVSQGIQ
jgi:hypothetical protein